jgi:tripartite ATP-independent transporter DctM subunit
MITVLFVLLFVLIMLGFPISFALAGSSLIYILVIGQVPPAVVLHTMVNGMNSFPMIAVPFFIIVGNLMNHAGITDRIFNFAKAMVGWMHGGLGHVNILSSVIFAGMSGTAVADAGGLGTIEIKAMRDAGYDPHFAVAVTAASSTIGPIIPPSLTMVVYGVLASTSVGRLFAAGIVPGLLMAITLMIMVSWYAHRHKYPRDARFSILVLWETFRSAFLSLLTPIIIIGGILTGIFTPTEAAIIAVVYALFLGIFVYRTLRWPSFLWVSLDTIETTAIIMLIVGGASIFGWILTSTRTAEQFAELILGFTQNKYLILLAMNIILLVVGLFMETIAAMTILVPVLLPVVLKLGVDSVHFGLIMVLNLMIGLVTPPVGLVLYVISRVADIRFEECVRYVTPFIIPLIVCLLLITLVPEFSLWLPTLLYK